MKKIDKCKCSWISALTFCLTFLLLAVTINTSAAVTGTCLSNDTTIEGLSISSSYSYAGASSDSSVGSGTSSVSGNTVTITATSGYYQKNFLSSKTHYQTTTTLVITNNSGKAGTLRFDYSYSTSNATNPSLKIAGTTMPSSGSFSMDMTAGGTCQVVVVSGQGTGTLSFKAAVNTVTLSNVVFEAVTGTVEVALEYGNGESYTSGGCAVSSAVQSDGSTKITATPDADNIFVYWYYTDSSGTTQYLYNATETVTTAVTYTALFRYPKLTVTIPSCDDAPSTPLQLSESKNGTSASYTSAGTYTYYIPKSSKISATLGYSYISWVFNSTNYFGNQTITMPSKDTSLTLNAAASYSGTKYYSLEEALGAATSSGQVILLANYKMYTSASIPANIELVIPYSASDTSVSTDSSNLYANAAYNTAKVTSLTPKSSVYLTLTIPQGVTLTVNGSSKLILGGTSSGGNASYFAGVTTGAHSNIQLDDGAAIVVKSSGVMSAIGYVLGSGKITVESGGALYQPFAVYDYRAGGYFTCSAGKHSMVTTVGKLAGGLQTPFTRFSLPNVQTETEYQYGSSLYAYANMYALSDYQKCVIKMIGTDALIQPATNATITATYDASKAVRYSGVGKTTLIMNGGATMGSMVMTLSMPIVGDVTVTTASISFPVSYTFDVILENGTYNISCPIQVLPGASITVESDAVLNLNSGARMFVFDGLYDHTKNPSGNTYTTNAGALGNIYYPTTTDFQKVSGYNGMANLIVNGTLNINSGASFGGLIQTANSGAKIDVASDATLSLSEQVGMTGKGSVSIMGDYYFAGATVHTLNAQILDSSGTLFDIKGGYTYLSLPDVSGTKASYSYTVYTDASNTATSTSRTETLNANIQGGWYNYKAIFNNYDNSQLGIDYCMTGETPSYTGATPTQPETAQYTYTFSGWTPTITAITSDVTYTATFTEVTRKYTITWKNDDGTTFTTTTVEYGQVPTAPANNPTKAATEQYTYTFKGWSPALVAVTGNTSYTATYNAVTRSYTITFVDYYGDSTTQTLEYGTTITFPETITETLCYNVSFLGWLLNEENIGTAPSKTVTGVATYTSSYSVDSIKPGAITMTVNYNNLPAGTAMQVIFFVPVETVDSTAPKVLLNGADTGVDSKHVGEEEGNPIAMYQVTVDLTAAQVAEKATGDSGNAAITITYTDVNLTKQLDSVLLAYAKALQSQLSGSAMGSQANAMEAVMNYGAAVQTYFNAGNGFDFAGYTADEIEDYASNIDLSGNAMSNTENSITFTWKSANVNFRTEYNLRYYFTLENLPEGVTPTTATLTVTYTDGTATATYENLAVEADGSRYRVTYPVPASDLAKEGTTVKLVVTLSDDTTVESTDFAYGINAYLKRSIYNYTTGGKRVSGDTDGTKTEDYVNMLVSLIKLGEAVSEIESTTATE